MVYGCTHTGFLKYIKDMGAHDSIGTGQRPPSARQLKAGAKMVTEIHAILDTVGRLLLLGLNSVRVIKSSLDCLYLCFIAYQTFADELLHAQWLPFGVII